MKQPSSVARLDDERSLSLLQRLIAYGFWVILLYLYWVSYFVYTSVDFFAIWHGAQRFLQGPAPYGESETLLYMSRVWVPSAAKEQDFSLAGIAYPLTTFFFVAPLTLLPYSVAAGLWFGGAFVSAWHVLRRYHPYAPLLLLMPSWIVGLLLGQVAVWCMVFLLWWWVGYHERRTALALAMVLLLMLIKPQLALIPGLVLLLRDGRAFWRWFALSAMGYVVLIGLTEWHWHWLQPWFRQVFIYSQNVFMLKYVWVLWLAVPLLLYWRRWLVLSIYSAPIVHPYILMPLTLLWVNLPWFGLIILALALYWFASLGFSTILTYACATLLCWLYAVKVGLHSSIDQE